MITISEVLSSHVIKLCGRTRDLFYSWLCSGDGAWGAREVKQELIVGTNDTRAMAGATVHFLPGVSVCEILNRGLHWRTGGLVAWWPDGLAGEAYSAVRDQSGGCN